MSDNLFYRLAPFIQEFIYRNGWEELRGVQTEAGQVLFNSDAHLLIASGTASGKTEAAFLPILTMLGEDPSMTIGVLYIGPLKALINDQFLRLQDLLKEANIPVWHWHGDVGQSEKNRLIKNPRGILQITPESLESLLINKNTELVRLFGDLRFIIIDEIHVFMGSDRGNQIICQLERLARFMRTEPRRVGLSATLGDYSFAEEWLASGTNRSVTTVNVSGKQKTVRLSVEHFDVSDPSMEVTPNRGENAVDEVVVPEEDFDYISDYARYVFEKSKLKKTLIFVNNRSQAEEIVASLRQMAEKERLADIYHVHHGSISALLREAAEQAMREENRPAVTAATVTLELGIDLGQLERVIQLGAPSSVSSFLQRLGRSGRRGNTSEMWFVSLEGQSSGGDLLPDQIPWGLLQSIAIIQLYLEERWIEPIRYGKYPCSLLYHQTMSTLASMGELSPAALAQRVLTLTPFRSISRDDYREFLRHLLEIDHIQQTDERGLIVGLTGEQIVRNFRFYAVFPDNDEYSVRDEAREIGSIVSPPLPGERFALAGLTWEVVDVDLQHKVIFVRRVKGKAKISWNGGGANIHSRILARMKGVLIEDQEYQYLQPGAKKRLQEARQMARNAGLDRDNIVSLGGETYCIFPWMGTIAYRTLERCLRVFGADELGIGAIGGLSPYFVRFDMRKGGVEDLKRLLATLCKDNFTEESLVGMEEGPVLQKYDEFVPIGLRRKALAYDYLDLREMRKGVEG